MLQRSGRQRQRAVSCGSNVRSCDWRRRAQQMRRCLVVDIAASDVRGTDSSRDNIALSRGIDNFRGHSSGQHPISVFAPETAACSPAQEQCHGATDRPLQIIPRSFVGELHQHTSRHKHGSGSLAPGSPRPISILCTRVCIQHQDLPRGPLTHTPSACWLPYGVRRRFENVHKHAMFTPRCCCADEADHHARKKSRSLDRPLLFARSFAVLRSSRW